MSIFINEYAKNLIRSEMKLNNVSSKKMCNLLKEKFNTNLNEKSFNNKLSRSNFSANFFFECMYVLDIEDINFNKTRVVLGEKNEKH